MNIAPSTAYEAVYFDGTTGRAGTIRLRTIDNDGTVTQAASNANITERATGVYAAERTSPGTAGQYTLVWDDGTDTGVLAVEDLLVTGAQALIAGNSQLYITADELKELLHEQAETFEDAAIDIAIPAACRACDGYKRTRFYPSTQTRYFQPRRGDPELILGHWNTVTAVTVDTDGDGTYDETWTAGTDYVLAPVNAQADGVPYDRMILLPQAGKRFPGYMLSVKVTGSFGWAETPIQVKQAAALWAIRLLTRVGSAPLGILVAAANDAVAMARIGRIDSDIAAMLDSVNPTVGYGSVRLG